MSAKEQKQTDIISSEQPAKGLRSHDSKSKIPARLIFAGTVFGVGATFLGAVHADGRSKNVKVADTLAGTSHVMTFDSFKRSQEWDLQVQKLSQKVQPVVNSSADSLIGKTESVVILKGSSVSEEQAKKYGITDPQKLAEFIKETGVENKSDVYAGDVVTFTINQGAANIIEESRGVAAQGENPQDGQQVGQGEKDKKDNSGEDDKDHKEKICHKADDKKYVEITVDDNSLDAHRDHGDIIPAPAEGCPKTEEPTATSTQEPTGTTTQEPTGTSTQEPTNTVEPTNTAASTNTVQPTNTVEPTATSTPFLEFPNCEDQKGPGDRAHYETGKHWIVGDGLLEGSDDVYNLNDGNALQCFCPPKDKFIKGDEGIQTDWIDVHTTDKPADKPGFFTIWGPDFGLNESWYYASGADKPSPTTPNFDCNPEAPTATPSNTATVTATSTPVRIPVRSATPTITATRTSTATSTATASPTFSPTPKSEAPKLPSTGDGTGKKENTKNIVLMAYAIMGAGIAGIGASRRRISERFSSQPGPAAPNQFEQRLLSLRQEIDKSNSGKKESK